jgi:hypothetical protein
MRVDWIEFECDGAPYVLYVRAPGPLDIGPTGEPVLQGTVPYVWAVDVADRIVEVCPVNEGGDDSAQIAALMTRACARIRQLSVAP